MKQEIINIEEIIKLALELKEKNYDAFIKLKEYIRQIKKQGI